MPGTIGERSDAVFGRLWPGMTEPEGTLDDWVELRDLACSRHNKRTARHLLGIPLLAHDLAEGLAQFGYSCAEFAAEHLG
jgi:uncharacterized protein DUF3775